MKEKDIKHDPEILAKLQAKTFYLVDEINPPISNPDGQWVIFEDKGSVKLGILPNKYYHRYGVDVRVVLKRGAQFPWAQSKSMLTSERYVSVLKMMVDGTYKRLPVFDVTELELIRD
jgi:hypothetical protein